ncbi:MAG: hypothetical protein NWQ45_14410 [Congregibacter sp.]|nr:hypothetical protein [Congregibacter sp.]
MRLLPLLIVGNLLLFAVPSLAGAEPYGKMFVEEGGAWVDEAPPGSLITVVPLATPEAEELLQRLQERLEQQEFSDGPYAMSLAETLDELARAQEAMGAPELARRSRERALHLIRVNDGLYSPAQRPVLRAMLDSLRSEGDFEALDERYDYFYRLYGSGQPPWNDLRWGATLEYLRWQREALRRDLDSDPMNRLMRLHSLHEDLLENLRASLPDVDYPKLKAATLSQLKSLYLIEDLIQPLPVFPERRVGFIRPDDPRDFNMQRERLENLQRMLRGSGRTLLEDLLAITPAEDVRGRAELQLALADWFQWLGSSREARVLYQGIWNALQAAGLGELATDWFSRPVPLPDNGVFWLSEGQGPEVGGGKEKGQGPFVVSLDVRENGRASAEVISVPAMWQRSTVRLQRLIAATQFRPVVRDGQVVAVENVYARYLLFEP